MSSLVKSTGIVSFSTLSSRIFGFIREICFAAFFGASQATDAFFIAFRIPNLLRRLVAEGSLTISFIPVYTDYLVNKGRKESLLLAQKTFSLLLLVLATIIVLGEVFAPQIVKVFAYGFQDPTIISLAINFTRIMFPYLVCASFVAFSMGILNSHGYFFAPAFSSVFLNLSMITGIIFFSSFFKQPLYGVTAGVLLGGLLQIVFQIPYLIKAGFKVKFSLSFNHPGLKKIFRLIVPTLFGTAIYQVNILMGTILASFLPSGSVSYLYFSDRLTEMVLGIFIISIGNVIFPEMSKIAATNDYKKIRKLYLASLKGSLFLAIPASLALMTIGFPIIAVFFWRGEFTLVDAQRTAQALWHASLGISSVAILRITSPTFFSLKDTKTPVLLAGLAFILNIGLGFFLMRTSLKHAGLALANSISVTVQVIILFYLLQKKIGRIKLSLFFKAFAKYLLAGLIMAFSINYLSGLIDWLEMALLYKIGWLSLIVGVGGLIYFIACFLLRVEEINILFRRRKKG